MDAWYSVVQVPPVIFKLQWYLIMYEFKTLNMMRWSKTLEVPAKCVEVNRVPYVESCRYFRWCGTYWHSHSCGMTRIRCNKWLRGYH